MVACVSSTIITSLENGSKSIFVILGKDQICWHKKPISTLHTVRGQNGRYTLVQKLRISELCKSRNLDSSNSFEEDFVYFEAILKEFWSIFEDILEEF